MNRLFRRGGVWWARLAVPLRLRAAAGRREFVQSTRTYHFEIAKVVASGLLAAWRQRLFSLESQTVNDHEILKLIQGDPLLAVSGFLTIEEASQATGLSTSELLRQVQSGALSLHYTLTRSNGEGFILSKYQLDAVDPELGVDAGFVSPDLKRGELRAKATHTDMAGKTLRLVRGDLFASHILRGDNSIEQITLQALSPAKPHEFFFPENDIGPVRIEELLLSKEEVEKLRVTLASKVSPERIKSAQTAIDNDRAFAAAAAAAKAAGKSGKWAKKRFSAGVEEYCKDPHGLTGLQGLPT